MDGPLVGWVFQVTILWMCASFGYGYNSLSRNGTLQLSVVKILAHNATFQWSGLTLSSQQSDSFPKCTLSYGYVKSIEKQLLTDIFPVDYTLELGHLEAKTEYELTWICEKDDQQYRSRTVQFTTADEGEVIVPTTTTATTSQTQSPSVTSDWPTVQKEKIGGHLNPVDIAIGVVFGAIALGIVWTIMYYIVRKVRRRQRIRRFLQYRQQENDPFPGLEQQDDDDDIPVNI